MVVIGGGITGVGCALDAASRGLRTALVERDDFASGTSSLDSGASFESAESESRVEHAKERVSHLAQRAAAVGLEVQRLRSGPHRQLHLGPGGDERAQHPDTWRGLNLLGFALMEARSILSLNG